MSECQRGTTLEDNDGDHWTLGDKGLWSCDTGFLDSRTIEDLEEDFGPLKIIKEVTERLEEAGYGFTPTAQPFAGMKVLAEALTKPDLGVLPIAAWRQATSNLSGIPIIPVSEAFTSDVPLSVINKATASSGESFPGDAFSVYHEAFNILLKKNADYGPSNIADSPGGPLNGILVRMWDKMSRLRHLVESGATPENESLRDTLMDMANYSLIAMIVLDGNWPGMDGDE